MGKIILLMSLFVFTPLINVYAADICQGKVINSLKTKDDPNPYYKVGDTITAITQYNYDIEKKSYSFCSHGGGCYPRYNKVNGKTVESIQLKNCSIGEIIDRDQYEISYKLNVDRKNNSTSKLRFNDIENKLLDFNMCSACANNATNYYIKQPNSKCGKVVKSALEGNSDSINILSNNPSYCL